MEGVVCVRETYGSGGERNGEEGGEEDQINEGERVIVVAIKCNGRREGERRSPI